AELPEFGKPGYPSQSFITMAAQMRLGERDEAFKLLAQIEQKFQQITDAASRCRYWAYDGWTHVLGGHPDIAGSKFDRAISTAISVSPPSAACDALACIARIMAAAGRSADALRVLDLAVGQSVDMSGAIFSDRSGLIDSGTSRHAA